MLTLFKLNVAVVIVLFDSVGLTDVILILSLISELSFFHLNDNGVVDITEQFNVILLLVIANFDKGSSIKRGVVVSSKRKKIYFYSCIV